MKKLYDAVNSVFKKVSTVSVYFGAAVLFLVVVLIFIDVIMRYILNSPIPGQQELAELGTVIVVYFGLPYATRMRGHVRVETIPGRFSLKARSILYGILDLICCVFMVFVTIKVFQQAGRLALTPGNATLILRIPNFYIYYIASLGAVIVAVEFLLDGIRYFLEAAGASGAGKTEISDKNQKGAQA